MDRRSRKVYVLWAGGALLGALAVACYATSLTVRRDPWRLEWLLYRIDYRWDVAIQVPGFLAPCFAFAALAVGSARVRRWFREAIGALKKRKRCHWAWLVALYPLSFWAFCCTFHVPVLEGVAERVKSVAAVVFYPFMYNEYLFFEFSNGYSAARGARDAGLIWMAFVCYIVILYLLARLMLGLDAPRRLTTSLARNRREQ